MTAIWAAGVLSRTPTLLKVSSMQENHSESRALVTNRTMEIVTAIFFLTVAAIFISDALRLGISWNFDGPAAGYFPFYIAVIMAISSIINLLQAFTSKEAATETFVTVDAVSKVLQVLIPLAVYIFSIEYVGIYVASAVYIIGFMLWLGRFPLWKAIPVGVAISFLLFMMFEVWFLTPLPKGPLETWLGY
jgi:putative tricarboxylic transport membrane protein